MEEDLSSEKRAGTWRGLSLLAVVAAAAAAAAWVWPLGDDTHTPLQPDASLGSASTVAPSVQLDAQRSPLDVPTPVAASSRGLQVRDASLELAREPLRDEAARMSEREHYQRFLALAAQDRAALESAAGRVLGGAGPNCKKVALLRALRASASPQVEGWLEHAVFSVPDASGAAADSVPSYALGQLIGDSARDLRARAALERIAFGPRRAPDRLRRVAASSLAASASESELWRLAQDMSAEEDALMRASVLEALSRNRDPSAVAAVFGHVQDGQGPGGSQPPEE